MAIGSPTSDRGLYPILAMAEVYQEEVRFLRLRPHETDSEQPGRVSVSQLDANTANAMDGPAVDDKFVPIHDSTGAIRGLIFVLGFYVVMGCLSLGGFMLWDWLK